MIAEQLINLLFTIIKAIYGIISSVLPHIQIGEHLIEYTMKILEICTQGANFVRFMIGDYAIALIEMSIILLIYKYTIFPIVQFIRSIFVNSN